MQFDNLPSEDDGLIPNLPLDNFTPTDDAVGSGYEDTIKDILEDTNEPSGEGTSGEEGESSNEGAVDGDDDFSYTPPSEKDYSDVIKKELGNDLQTLGEELPENATEQDYLDLKKKVTLVANAVNESETFVEAINRFNSTDDEIIVYELMEQYPLESDDEISERLNKLYIDGDKDNGLTPRAKALADKKRKEYQRIAVNIANEAKKSAEEELKKIVSEREESIRAVKELKLDTLEVDDDGDKFKVEMPKIPNSMKYELLNFMRDNEVKGKTPQEKAQNAALLFPKTRDLILKEVAKKAYIAGQTRALKN